MTDFEALIRRLGAADIRFVLVGGFAGTILGSPRTHRRPRYRLRPRPGESGPSRDRPRVSPAEVAWGAPPGLPFVLDAATLTRGLNFTLTTSLGDLDLLGDVTGGGGYEDLAPHTHLIRVFDTEVAVVTLPQLIRLKRAAGRPKDLAALAELEALLEEQGREP